MARSNPQLCSDNNLAETACPRFCNICPIECYHCDAILSDFRDCNSTKFCAQHEVCMQKVLTATSDGHRSYKLSCEKKERCDGGSLALSIGRRGLGLRDVSITCCLDDRCNYPGPWVPTTPPSTTSTMAPSSSPVLIQKITTSPKSSTSPCRDTKHPQICHMMINQYRLCDTYSKASQNGCLASCGYCSRA